MSSSGSQWQHVDLFSNGQRELLGCVSHCVYSQSPAAALQSVRAAQWIESSFYAHPSGMFNSDGACSDLLVPESLSLLEIMIGEQCDALFCRQGTLIELLTLIFDKA
ncbi:hypothetical protein ACVBEG_27850 [Pseudomonas sp. GG8]